MLKKNVNLERVYMHTSKLSFSSVCLFKDKLNNLKNQKQPLSLSGEATVHLPVGGSALHLPGHRPLHHCLHRYPCRVRLVRQQGHELRS